MPHDAALYLSQVLRSATALLAKFISTREPNIKYLGLETLMRLVEVPAVVETIDKWDPSLFRSIGALLGIISLLHNSWWEVPAVAEPLDK